jgi:hypothetical protein
MNLGWLGAGLVLVCLQREVKKNIPPEFMCLLGEQSRRRAAGQKRKRNGARELQSAFTVRKVIAEVVDDDGDPRRICRGRRRKTQEERKQEPSQVRATWPCCA